MRQKRQLSPHVLGDIKMNALHVKLFSAEAFLSFSAQNAGSVRTRWWSLQRSPRSPSWTRGPPSKGMGGKGNETGEDGRGGEILRPHNFPTGSSTEYKQNIAPEH